uniref:Uncharacterized protein n=1 Tax=Cacopsylla melanoneura TaxID=428564 RepID=A0A8D9FHV2_9HEMI
MKIYKRQMWERNIIISLLLLLLFFVNFFKFWQKSKGSILTVPGFHNTRTVPYYPHKIYFRKNRPQVVIVLDSDLSFYHMLDNNSSNNLANFRLSKNLQVDSYSQKSKGCSILPPFPLLNYPKKNNTFQNQEPLTKT